MRISWVFDVISPYSYLSLKQHHQLPANVELEYVPVLFAGLLNHHGQIGNAEIASKRRFTYRFVVWRARKLGIPLRMPPAHPFNPLFAQRLIIAAGSDRRAAEIAFEYVFERGLDVANPAVLADMARALGIENAQQALNDPRVKDKLRENTDWAIARGVFGVPTFVAGEELFWGHDALEMVTDFLRDRQAFEDPEMRRVGSMPVGVARVRKG